MGVYPIDMKHYDLLIIGGGVLGVFHAYHALNRGLKTALFERNSQPEGATVRNFGQVVPSGMNVKWQETGRKSLDFYKALQAKHDIGVRSFGSIYIASDEEELTLAEELHAINQANDYPSELLTPAACMAKYPNLRSDYCKGGLFFPEEISVNPRVMIHRVLAHLLADPNFDYFPGTLIRALEEVGPACLATDNSGRQYRGEQAFVCSGVEFEWLYPELFRESDLEVVKLQMLNLKPQRAVQLPGNILTGLSIRRYESFSECPSWSAIKAREATDSFWKQWGIHILFKQEADGSIILGDSHEYASVGEGQRSDFYVREEISRYFIEAGQAIFQLEHWNIDQQWLGYYSQSKTKDIFRHTLGGKIHLVTGIGGKGMTASPGYAADNLSELFD